MHVKKGDKVIVIAGRDKGKVGQVLEVIRRDDRVVVENVNVVKKHQKANAMNPEGGILEIAKPIHVSNVMHVDPESNTKTRIKTEIRDGKKIRIAKKSQKEIK